MDSYRNPHRRMSDISNPVEARKREKLISTIDKYRDNAQVIAKLQNSLEENMMKSYLRVADQLKKYL